MPSLAVYQWPVCVCATGFLRCIMLPLMGTWSSSLCCWSHRLLSTSETRKVKKHMMMYCSWACDGHVLCLRAVGLQVCGRCTTQPGRGRQSPWRCCWSRVRLSTANQTKDKFLSTCQHSTATTMWWVSCSFTKEANAAREQHRRKMLISILFA